MALYCTIIAGGYGSPHRYYPTAQQALAAAQRHCKRTGEGMSVAWCKHRDNPKAWLAEVTPAGTEYTKDWQSTVDGDDVDRTMREHGFKPHSDGKHIVWQWDFGGGSTVWISHHDTKWGYNLWGDPRAAAWLVIRNDAGGGWVQSGDRMTLADALALAPRMAMSRTAGSAIA
jgi:hypothetical protein